MNLEIIHKELILRTSRSSGAGGQHVNKVATKVDLMLPIATSNGLDDEEKKRIKKRLGNRINKEGMLVISCQDTRSQALNRSRAIKKLEQLLAKAIRPAPRRKAVQKPVADTQKRLKSKRLRSEKKEMRKKVTLPIER